VADIATRRYIALMAASDALDTRVVNALLPHAAPLVGAMPNSMRWLTEFFRRLLGGLWVGGNAVLTNTELVFTPNALNSALHQEPEKLHLRISLEDIKGVQVRWGFVTKIIDVETRTATWSLRCYGAAKFAESIERVRSSV
ncbi:MAG: hypothetical protein C0471_17735, partial [Erythrobacter sp.]|nr:hypothetical protein [Erythrobacter sp.]